MHAGNPVLDAVNNASVPRIARSAAIAGRRPPRLAGRADRRPGSWSRRDARSSRTCVRHQPLDLPLNEIASFNCQIYDGWRMFLDADFTRINLTCEPPSV